MGDQKGKKNGTISRELRSTSEFQITEQTWTDFFSNTVNGFKIDLKIDSSDSAKHVTLLFNLPFGHFEHLGTEDPDIEFRIVALMNNQENYIAMGGISSQTTDTGRHCITIIGNYSVSKSVSITDLTFKVQCQMTRKNIFYTGNGDMGRGNFAPIATLTAIVDDTI